MDGSVIAIAPRAGAIARVAGVSQRWLQLYVNQKFCQTPHAIAVTPKNRSMNNSIGWERWSALN
ncbi:MAG: hypothetical protein HC919_09335 [Oscillatoriales cyanobacterium SM2_2_1]|nr:hypothetical protein [Oscillatoriales cyanobacterium SM2_2_1]